MDSPESSPPSVSRDWFSPSPSPSFIQSADHLHKTPARRFSTYPRPSSNTPPLHTTSSSSSHRDHKYAGLSRRTNFSRRYHPTPEVVVSSLTQQISQICDVSDDKTSVRYKFTDLAGGRLKFRWHMAFLVALLITTFSSLLHKNISLYEEDEETDL